MKKKKTYKIKAKAIKEDSECKLNISITPKNAEEKKFQRPVRCDLRNIIYLTNQKHRMYDFYPKTYRDMTSTPERIEAAPDLNTLNQLFNGCDKIVTVDLIGFDASGITDFSYMFQGMYALQTIKGIEDFDTSNATTTNSMFALTRALTSLDLSKWNVSNVTDMNSMFSTMTHLQTLNISGWDTSKVENFNYMFKQCAVLKEIKGVFDFASAKAGYYESMFDQRNPADLIVTVKNAPKGLTAGKLGLKNSNQLVVLSYR